MILQPILALLLLRYFRKSLDKAMLPGKWDRLLKTGTGISILLIVLFATIKESRQIVSWLAHIFLLVIVYQGYYSKELRNARSAINAFLPATLVYLITDVVIAFNKSFYKAWENYFDAAGLFALIWMVAMMIINGRQQKALDKERLKTEELERESRITEKLKAELEVQVNERTAELTAQKEELQQTLNELRSTQTQLIQSEKMASLGELTAGIAHEIQNPLNFVNNFSEVNSELIAEMKAELVKGNIEEAKTLATDIDDNEKKIIFHGKRADAIVKGMLQHSRSSSGVKEPTDINALADEYLRLAYHGLRAKDKSFNATMKTDFDEALSAGKSGTGMINIIPQDIGRVILNLITNAFYVVAEKKKKGVAGYEPTVTVSTKKTGHKVEIKVADNGNGIPQKILGKIFQPFFTTKPTGQGTGLGLSMSYDIVTKGHSGELKVETKDGEGSQFIIILNT